MSAKNKPFNVLDLESVAIKLNETVNGFDTKKIRKDEALIGLGSVGLALKFRTLVIKEAEMKARKLPLKLEKIKHKSSHKEIIMGSD